jgi:GGDEF domain-containing protein
VRWGGEEFVIALPDSPAEEALHLIERLRPAGVTQVNRPAPDLRSQYPRDLTFMKSGYR